MLGETTSLSMLIEELRSTAERTLGFAPIEAGDDLFDFGCDSILCLVLLLNIEQMTGQLLTPAEFYDAPTIQGVAETLHAKRTMRIA